MRKRSLLVILTLFTLVAGFAQLRSILSPSAQHFVEEREDMARMQRLNPSKPIDGAYSSQFAPTRMIDGVEMIDAFIGINDKAVIQELRDMGVIVNCEFDDFVTSQIPVALLHQVSSLKGVTDVEISKMLELCTDSTLSLTHAGQVLNGTEYGLPQAYDGSGVIIGIIDNGFDYQHLAFRCADDTSRTRIVRVYDPMDTTGHVARVGNNVLPGSIFMGEQIDTLRSDNLSGSENTHGTHTASIAAGMHVGPYGGMAPGADIVMCSSRELNLGLSEVEVVNCIKYIYSYADSVGKPCVISVSVSTYSGPHDGNDRISKAVAAATGPGHIFVIAAGNNGNRPLYVSGMARPDKPVNILIGQSFTTVNANPTFNYKSLWFDTWAREKNVRPIIRYHILDLQTRHIVWQSDYISLYKRIDASEISQYYHPDYSVDSVGYLTSIVSLYSSGKYELQCKLQNLKSSEYTVSETGRYNSRYAIGISIYPPSVVYPRQADSCYIDSWIALSTGSYINYQSPVLIDEVNENGDTVTTEVPYFYAWPSDYCSIGSFAVHDSIISAGGYVGRNSFYSITQQSVLTYPETQGSYYNSTSFQAAGYGPTGAALPTVTAPATWVVAAGSRYSYFGTNWHSARSMIYNGNTWGSMTGTSMAAPTVAGIIAQWLQIDPTLSPSNIKHIIAQTAIKDDFTQDPGYGFRFGPNGKIDAMAGVRYLLHLQPSTEPLLGDVNDDGEVNISDITRLAAYLINTPSPDGSYIPDGNPLNEVNADFNQDGLINISDAVLLISYVLNLDPGEGEGNQ